MFSELLRPFLFHYFVYKYHYTCVYSLEFYNSKFEMELTKNTFQSYFGTKLQFF